MRRSMQIAKPCMACIALCGEYKSRMTSEQATSSPTEVLFYHLEQQTLEKVLPSLVEKTLERGWRAVVQAGSQERRKEVAPRAGLEPATSRLTAGCSTN